MGFHARILIADREPFFSVSSDCCVREVSCDYVAVFLLPHEFSVFNFVEHPVLPGTRVPDLMLPNILKLNNITAVIAKNLPAGTCLDIVSDGRRVALPLFGARFVLCANDVLEDPVGESRLTHHGRRVRGQGIGGERGGHRARVASRAEPGGAIPFVAATVVFQESPQAQCFMRLLLIVC